MTGIHYTIKHNRLSRGYHRGMELKEDGTLVGILGEGIHTLCLPALDSAEEDATWGRVSFSLQMEENTICYVYAMALNEDFFYQNGEKIRVEQFLFDPEVPDRQKQFFLEEHKAVRFVGQSDVLLYALTGRYLYLMFRIMGEGEFQISNIRIDRIGDNFMNTFPEVYRERNSFFHRYLSIFSSIFNDFQEDIHDLPRLLDLNTCPRELLPIYGKWLGIDITGDFLEEEQERTLVKEAYSLNRMKGTKAAVARICEILLGEEVRVLEQNVMKEYVTREEAGDFMDLYGRSPYDVTILVNRPISETLRYQLMFLLNQFRPVRSKIRIVSMESKGMLDAHSYLDINARIFKQEEGSLDESKTLDSYLVLL